MYYGKNIIGGKEYKILYFNIIIKYKWYYQK